MDKHEITECLRATRGVEGWFFPVDAYFFGAIDEAQKRAGIRGNLFEIGVHHGKTAIFLARMRRDGEVLGVCDVFERQDLNTGFSGAGNREIYETNMRTLGGPADVYTKLSGDLTTGDTTTDCRFFHIDGGHQASEVFADLETANRAIHDNGVVALDDLFNASWPGVSEAFYRFVATYPHALVPILVGGNKAYFSRPGAPYAFDDIASMVDTRAFHFVYKEWLGRKVMTAIRLSWVDLDPMGAAQLHA